MGAVLACAKSHECGIISAELLKNVCAMKIFYEQSMPYAADFFQDWGQCEAFNGKTLTAEQLTDADLLFVRSTTQVNQGLLSKAQKLKFVATATAGTDHLDTEYLTQRGIGWASAAGCNAVAVAEYVLSALFVMAERLNWCLTDKKVGIVGAGHVGTALSQKLTALNINYLLCDPPLAEQGDSRDFVSLDEVMGCDVIQLTRTLDQTRGHIKLTVLLMHKKFRH